MNYVIMGIDRIGKNTFINTCLPNHNEIHLSKPPKDCDPLLFTKAEYADYFINLKKSDNIVYNRGHIDEFVYGPMYRNQNTYWLKIYEQEFAPDLNNTTLILLLSKNFNVMEDDGNSLDYSKREEEQNLFIKHFDESPFLNKFKIYTIDENGYRNPEDIKRDFPSKRYFKIDTRSMSKEEAEEHMKRIKEQFKAKFSYDPVTGDILKND